MCDPLTLTAAATAVTMIGQGVSAVGASQQARYESRVADRNRAMESERARDAIDRGREESWQVRDTTRRTIGTQRATMGANGIDLSFGNAADLVGDTAVAGGEDSRRTMDNSMREARGYEISAMNAAAESDAARRRGKAALVQGAFGMASTALGGATQFQRMRYQRRG